MFERAYIHDKIVINQVFFNMLLFFLTETFFSLYYISLFLHLIFLINYQFFKFLRIKTQYKFPQLRLLIYCYC